MAAGLGMVVCKCTFLVLFWDANLHSLFVLQYKDIYHYYTTC